MNFPGAFGNGKGLEGVEAWISVVLPGGRDRSHPPKSGQPGEIKVMLTKL